MKIRADLSETFFEQGFTTHTDPFERRDLAERMTHLYSHLQQGTVAILHGRWGTGKSVFARQWSHHLRNAGIGSIYFDAFAADYIESPFQAVSSAFLSAAREAQRTDTPAYRKFLSNAARATKKIGATGAKIGAKILTVGVIGAAEIQQLSDLKDDLASSAGEISEESVKKMLEEQADSETTFKALRNSLADLPALLAPTPSDVADTDEEAAAPTLVVIIDELDRCRPDFALGVLETLKHFFRAERVHFVLVTNRAFLLKSVDNRYGLGDASEEYIQKYYDFMIHLEEKKSAHTGGDAVIYLKHLLRTMLPSHVPSNDRHHLQTHLEAITVAYGLTLRQVESLLTNVLLAYLAIVEREYRPVVLVCFLAALKAFRPHLYAEAKLGRLSYHAFREFAAQGAWPEQYDMDHVSRIIRYHNDPTLDEHEPEFRGFGQGLFQFQFTSRLAVIPYVCNAILDRFGKI